MVDASVIKAMTRMWAAERTQERENLIDARGRPRSSGRHDGAPVRRWVPGGVRAAMVGAARARAVTAVRSGELGASTTK